MSSVEQAVASRTNILPARAGSTPAAGGRRVRFAVALLAVSLLALALLATVFTAAPALALPEGRVYEMVSPPYKGAYGTQALDAIAPDGQSVAFISQGAFAGMGVQKLKNEYLAHRGSSGWKTVPLEPPATVAPEGDTVDFSQTLSSSLWQGVLAPNGGTADYESPEIAYLTSQSGWQVAGRVLETIDSKPYKPQYHGASPDFCHILFDTQGDSKGLLQVAAGTAGELYDLSTGCEGEPALRLVGLNNQGRVLDPYCNEFSGGFDEIERATFNAVANDGHELFFTAFTNPTERKSGCGYGIPSVSRNPTQVFVRLGGSLTLEVSRPLDAGAFAGCDEGGKAGETPGEVPCADASSRAPSLFWGASADGSKVLFTTKQPLVPGDSDASENLYLANIGCPGGAAEACEVAQRRVTALTRVSAPLAPGEGAEVQGVVRIAPDASRVYFVARGRLSEGSGVEGRTAVRGADNLYSYDTRSGTLAFVADLCSGPGRSGAIEDVRCPSDLQAEGTGERNDVGVWQGEVGSGVPEAQVAGGEGDPGRFLVFSTYARLAKGDTDNAKDVYRYDTVTGGLDRVSVGEGGYDTNGNCNDAPGGTACDALVVSPLPPGQASSALFAQLEMGSRAISEDGSRIVFRTSEPLSPEATNGLLDVYEWSKQPGWSEGRVSLVSSGSSPVSDSSAVISPSGGDVFFQTSQGLVPGDTDGQTDIYDAHECTARAPCFAPPPSGTQPCSGDACQGPLTNPAPLLIPGSVPQAPGGNFRAPVAKARKVKVKKVKAGKAKAKRNNGKRARGSRHSARAGRGGR